jgi:hypothetical protein
MAGTAFAALVLGPAAAPGSLFNLDLVVTPVIPAPVELWGLGPELPRRAPFYLVLAWLSTWGGGAGAWKLLAAASLAGAFAGATRLVRDRPLVTQVGAGLVYAASPWMLTRLGVGHLGLVLAAALLPFALPTLLDPTRCRARTFLWSLAFAVVGLYGALLAVPLVVAGLVGRPLRRAASTLVAFAAPHLMWLLPGVIVFLGGVQPASAHSFRPTGESAPDAVRLLAGHGFWQSLYQVGSEQGWVAVGIGGALLGLALLGHRDLPSVMRTRLAGVAAVGIGVPFAARMPGLQSAFDWLSGAAPGLALREPQRLLVLYLLWLAPAAALGAGRVAAGLRGWYSGAMAAAPAVLALILTAPGLWGVQGTLQPVAIPESWEQARAHVRAEPGTVLALPWHRYFDLGAAEGRRVLNPMPYYLGGDVLASADPELPGGEQEVLDPRHRRAEEIIEAMRRGEPPSDRLAELGVRWVVVLHDVDWWSYRRGLDADEDLEHVVGDGDLDLYRVTTWVGPIRTGEGEAVGVDCPLAVLCTTAEATAGVWYRPGTEGWRRGASPTTPTEDGLLALPAGSRRLVFVPGILVGLVNLAVLAGAVLAGAHTRRHPVTHVDDM